MTGMPRFFATAQMAGFEPSHIRVEGPSRPEEPGILGVQAEHDAHGQRGQRVMRSRRVRVSVFFRQGVVQVRYQLARAFGKLLLDDDA